jgi:hypothetical protein
MTDAAKAEAGVVRLVSDDPGFDEGVLVGILVGSGHFGGDGRQPQVTLKMHVRHEALFRWLGRAFPGGRLFGPYHHGGRDYYQWMARGPFLRDVLLPLLERRLSPELDRKAFEAVQEMRLRYARVLGPAPSAAIDPRHRDPAPPSA